MIELTENKNAGVQKLVRRQIYYNIDYQKRPETVFQSTRSHKAAT